MALSNTLIRVLTAAVLIPLVFILVLWAPDLIFGLVVALVALLTLSEYLSLADKSGLAPLRLFSYLAAAAIIAATLPGGVGIAVRRFLPMGALQAVTLGALAALALVMTPRRSLEKALSGAASSVLGFLYIATPLALLIEIREGQNGVRWVIYVLVLTWVSDTAAYFAGSAFGRHKLAPRISPGKTWEGSIASVAGAVLFGVIYNRYFYSGPDFPLAFSIVTALAVNVAGQVGDLAESALKRGAGVKDSSTLLPGHGGMLDRIDALLFAVPTLWYILTLRSMWIFGPVM